jgi:hypothetical protein
LARRQSSPGATAQEIEASARRLAHHAFRSVRMLTLLPDAPEAALLRDHYEHQVRESVPGMLLMGSLDAPQSPVEQCIRTYESRDTSRLPFVLEFIDTAFRGEHRAGIVPLLEQQSWSEKDEAGKRLYEDLPNNLDAELSYATASHDRWESSIARHFLAKTGKATPEGVVHLDSDMFSTLEKSILLKSVSLFRDIPAEKLSRIAAIAEERAVPPGTVILKAGDFGESMFVVASGSVRVHLEDRELTVFHRGDCVGEMSLLDGAPRSASATALEQTTLLEIDQQNFYEVMETYPEIMKEVVRLLTRRLREANDRIAAGK